MIQSATNQETPQRSWIERYFAWVCLILFVEVFIFYAATTYFFLIPQFVDLPDLKKLARTELDTPAQVDRPWLREGKWSWPLGGKILILPESFSIPSHAAPEQWIELWWERYSSRNGNATNNGAAANPYEISIGTANNPDRASVLANALRDYGPLIVKGQDSETRHVLMGDYTSKGQNEGQTLFLIRSANTDEEHFAFVRPKWIEQATAFPHPLNVQWEVEPPWTKLKVLDYWEQPLSLYPPEQMRLMVDGVIVPSQNTGIYYIRCSDAAEEVAIELRHDFLMPLPGHRIFTSTDRQ